MKCFVGIHSYDRQKTCRFSPRKLRDSDHYECHRHILQLPLLGSDNNITSRSICSPEHLKMSIDVSRIEMKKISVYKVSCFSRIFLLLYLTLVLFSSLSQSSVSIVFVAPLSMCVLMCTYTLQVQIQSGEGGWNTHPPSWDYLKYKKKQKTIFILQFDCKILNGIPQYNVVGGISPSPG